MSEIWHGSPYYLAEIEIEGKCPFEIKSANSWQDKHSWSRNRNFFAQVQWDTVVGDPGFKVVLFDAEKGEVEQTKRFEGCCHNIRLKNDLSLSLKVFAKIGQGAERNIYGIKNENYKLGYNNGYRP